MFAADILDRDCEHNDYQLIGKPTTEKYKIDGEKAGTYSYKELSDTSDFILKAYPKNR